LRYSINGGPILTHPGTLSSNSGPIYGFFGTSIIVNYGDVVSFFVVPVTGNNNLWGSGNGGTYTNIGCFPNTYNYTVSATGINNVYLNLSSQNSVWAITSPC
jgi:hypothetical protein